MMETVEIPRRNAIERIERDAWESLCRAAPAELARELGLEVHRFGEALMTICTQIDQGQFNRLLGLGLGHGEEDDRAIREAVSRFRAAGLRNPFVQIPPVLPERESAARAAGLVSGKRPWVKFHYGSAAASPIAPALDVVRAGDKDAALFGSVIAAGFGMPSALAGWLGALAERPGWRCYLVLESGIAIGGGALYIQDVAAWLGVGATKPEGRRRGSQTALLARRLADAKLAGATLITTETGKPLAGEDHPSYRNILRSGFELAYERANWSFAV
jgi:hypothetical protein